jgi:hypothetical protein
MMDDKTTNGTVSVAIHLYYRYLRTIAAEAGYLADQLPDVDGLEYLPAEEAIAFLTRLRDLRSELLRLEKEFRNACDRVDMDAARAWTAGLEQAGRLAESKGRLGEGCVNRPPAEVNAVG